MIDYEKELKKNNELFRKQISKKSAYLFDSQIDTAKKVMGSFLAKTTRKNHIILAAKMQSGKTGVCNAIVNIIQQTKIKKYLGIKKFIFITGMNDCGLKNQTYERIKSQCIGATKENIYFDKRSKKYETIGVKPIFFVLKNSDLMKFEDSIDGSIIFIDEAHYGSNEKNILTKFLQKHNIDWKNQNSLIKRNIYIVSVSATPFDEIVSDTKEVKNIVELTPSKEYVGVTELIQKGLIMEADKDDIEEDGFIFEYIYDAYQRMKDNNTAGFIFIRTLKHDIIENNKFVNENFTIHRMFSNGSKIEYDKFNEIANELVHKNEFNKRIDKLSSKMPCTAIRFNVKPIIVLIKGAFRAGITLDERIKDYTYMIYDYSLKADTTAQALMGRLCGYRDKRRSIRNTYVYVNKKFADMYSKWENNFQDRSIVPCSKTMAKWLPNSVTNPEATFGTRSRGNIAISLDESEIREIYQYASKVKNKVGYIKLILPKLLKKHGINLAYDYVGEALLSGKNNYASTSQLRRFDKFSEESLVYQFRPYKIKDFINDTNRNYLTKDDLGKSAVFVILDADISDGGLNIGGNKRLLIYNVEVGQKIIVPNTKSLYKKHKDTNLTV